MKKVNKIKIKNNLILKDFFINFLNSEGLFLNSGKENKTWFFTYEVNESVTNLFKNIMYNSKNEGTFMFKNELIHFQLVGNTMICQ
jgi:hypothetical protein